MWPFLSSLGNSLCEFVYPRFCVHCEELLRSDLPILCEACLSHLELLDPKDRCLTCFAIRSSDLSAYCETCSADPPLLYRRAAAFTYDGPLKTLLGALKYRGQEHLATGLGAYLLAQWTQLNWPVPDLVVPVPISKPKWFQRGFNQSQALGQVMAEGLGVSLIPVLARRYGNFSQVSLNRKQRLQLNAAAFSVQKKEDLRGKVILLLDDVTTTGATLSCCAEAILREVPCFVYGLTLAKTETI